ncbi:MAG: SGNH/GDSL hydrolase family protein [Clostridia bacterium]|nr:SGNH/GDSL hydrolase family protein [Clostridia bacterium]
MSKLILFQGDSITDGNRVKTNEWDLNHQMGHGYQFIINAKLGCEYPEKDYKFINRGISGNRISDLYGRWQEDAVRYSPDILSILVGVNDIHFYLENGSGSLADRYEKIYQLLIDEVKDNKADTEIVICEPFALSVKGKEDYVDKLMEHLVPIQEKAKLIAERNNAIFVPLQQKFNEFGAKYGNEYWIWDGIHPTVCGHQLIANEWLKCCDKLL